MARPRSESARQNVLAGALEVIAEAGVDNFTVEAVVKKSGVAKTTIYRHWDSTNHLLLDAMDSCVSPFPTPNTGSLRDDLIALYKSFIPMTEDPATFRMMLGMMARSAQDDAFRSLKNDFVQERHQPLRTILDLAKGRGEVPDDLDMELALDLIEGPFAFKRLMRGEAIAPDRIEAYVDAVLHGVCGPAR